MTYIADSLFKPHKAIHANGDRAGFDPAHVSWDRDWWDEDTLRPKREVNVLWSTDGHVMHVPKYERPHLTSVHLLLEPSDIHPENYRAASEELGNGIDHLFTHQPQYFGDDWEKDPLIHVYPLGGTMIHESDWRIWEDKQPKVSIIASDKQGLPGHSIRHAVAGEFSGHPAVHTYGPSYRPVGLNRHGYYHKLPTLAPYMFSLAAECVDTGYILSEHVLDCFLTGTMPIYWGPRGALEYWGFDPLGVLQAKYKEGLIGCVQQAIDQGSMLYDSRIEAIRRNFVRAHEYTCTEDWLWRHHPDLF